MLKRLHTVLIPAVVVTQLIGCSTTSSEDDLAIVWTDVPRTTTHPGVQGAPFPYAQMEEVGLNADSLLALGDLTARWVAQDRIVGAEILVIKDRKVVLHESMGWSDREAGIPMPRHSYFRLRSMTKPLTGAAALVLISEGAISYDTRISEFIPSWDNDRTRAITIEQLLAHRSGFVQGGWPVSPASVDSLRELVDACGEQGPEHRPGERFTYSDVNSFALGAIVAEVSGMPHERFIETRILDPLGLRDMHVGYTRDASWAGRMNPTYEKDESGNWIKYWTPNEESVFPYFRASGGLVSTAFEYARWLAYWIDAERNATPGDAPDQHFVLSSEIVRNALRSHGSDEIGDYGLHWEIRSEDPLIFGHAGSDGTLGFAIPSEDLMLLYFTQSRGSETVFEWLDHATALTTTSKESGSE